MLWHSQASPYRGQTDDMCFPDSKYRGLKGTYAVQVLPPKFNLGLLGRKQTDRSKLRACLPNNQPNCFANVSVRKEKRQSKTEAENWSLLKGTKGMQHLQAPRQRLGYSSKNKQPIQAQWHVPVMPAHRRRSQENLKFEASLSCLSLQIQRTAVQW